MKFLNELHGERILVNLDLGNASNDVRRQQLLQLLGRNKMVQIVLIRSRRQRLLAPEVER